MSLYLIELKIKTALEIVENIERVNAGNRTDWTRNTIAGDTIHLRNILREIINRPKEEGNNG